MPRGNFSDVNHAVWKDLADYTQYMPERYRNTTEEQENAGHNGGDFFLVQDFADAIRQNKKPDIDIYQACK